MIDHTGGETNGLFAALKGIAATLLASGKTRLELLGNEIEEEKLRAMQLLLMAQGMVFCFGVGVILAVALISVLFWDNRLLVLGVLRCYFLLPAAFSIHASRMRHNGPTGPLPRASRNCRKICVS